MSVMKGSDLGSVGALWRYPVKSMLGEQLNAAAIGQRGLVGDRVYAVVDPDTGKVASAKNPKKWPRLFDCRSAFAEPPAAEGEIPPVVVTLPDGRLASSETPGFDHEISAMLGRPGRLQMAVPDQPVLEEYWPDIEGLDFRDEVTDESIPAGTFFDLAPIHLLTTATLDRLRQVYPAGRFEVPRFRPNIVIRSAPGECSFVENSWVDETIAIGDEVRLKITGHTPRCVMTTLPQDDLPADAGILRAAATHNDARVGIYAEVIQGGSVRRGDAVRLG